MRRSIRRRGVTLVDLVIVVLIMGIMAATAGPKFANSVTLFQSRSAAHRVAADLRYARSHALQVGADQQVVFTLSSHSYSLTGLKDINHVNQSYTVGLQDTSYPALLSTVNFGAGGTAVTFDKYGRPDNGGIVNVTVSGITHAITVDANTGKVSVVNP